MVLTKALIFYKFHRLLGACANKLWDRWQNHAKSMALRLIGLVERMKAIPRTLLPSA
ncbi:MAG: hypothetical protein RLZZ490_1017 [Cyanobacteriota bacterium]